MNKHYFHSGVKYFTLLTILFLLVPAMQAQVVTQNFTFTGATQTFVVPPCVGTITVDLRGAEGANSADKLPTNSTGGLGGRSQGIISVTQGQILTIFVGGAGNINGNGGFNGGGSGGLSTAGQGACLGGYAGGGGGASDIRANGIALANRIVVAGGGGGSGRDYCNGSCLPCGCGGSGGAGGGFTGISGQAANICNGSNGGSGINGGFPGSLLAAGLAGPPDAVGGGIGTNGLFATGGDGASGAYDVAGGGGGGGYFGGGGGGGAGSGSGVGGGGGGGGSSYFAANVSNSVTTQSFQSGNGLVTLSYNFLGSLTTLTVSPPAICIGSSSTLTASGQVGYTWTPGGSNANSIVVSPIANTSYTVQGQNSLGCITSVVVTVTVDTTIPSLSVASTFSSVCQGKPVTITASGANTYTWTNNITNGIPYTPISTSQYTVSGSNACGTSTAGISITVNPSPTITASVSNPTICSGGSVIFTGGGGTSYTWSNGVLNNVAVVPVNTATYLVIGSSVNGCTNTAVASVTVLITPTITPVVTPTAICFGSTATLSAIGATGYTWTPGVSVNAASVTVSPLSTTIYTLVRTNGACTSTANVTLVIDAIPSIIASASPTQICVGEPVVLNVFGAISYTWSPGNFSASNFTLYPNSSTCYTVAGSNGSCSAVSAICVSVNPSPSINILTPTISVCEGSSITFTATGAPSYTWLTTGANINNSNITVTPSVTSQYTVLGSNAFNCVVAKTQLVIVNPAPSLSLTSNIPYACVGSAAILSVGATLPNTNNVYTWSGGATGSGPSITVNPTITTSYIATGVNTQNGCTRTDTITLSVYISTFVVSSPTAICKGSTGVFSANGAANSYDWFGPSGNIATTSSVSVSPSNSTTYYVTGTTGSCTTTQTVPLIVNVLPNVTAVSAKPQLCRLEFGTVTASGATSYVWAHGVTTAMFTFNTLTITTTYTVTGTDNNGCSKKAFVTQYIATCAGIDALTGNTSIGLTIYPNPNNGNFSISSEADITVSIVNAMGQVVSTMSLSKENKNEITVSSLPTGIYFITGEKNGLRVNKKIIVEK